MENNELMNVEEIEVVDDVVVAEEKTGISTGGAMLIGAGLALAVSAGFKLAKKKWAAFKAKKEAKKSGSEVQVENEDIEDVEEV